MIKIEQYSLSYRPDEDSGMVHLALANGEGANLPISSPSEAQFLLYLLKNDDDVFFDPKHRLISTGIEGMGEE
ncbi:MAG: hypothetical protein AAF798_14940 [Bacteroidota bacterium]